MASVILSLVVPCYNEAETLPETARILREKYTALISQGKISSQSKIVFVDDGSSDATWELISELHNKNPNVVGVKLSCNQGHQNALLAGLMTAKTFSDAVISIDADLQDDVSAVDEMLAVFYEQKADIIFGVRSDRKNDSFFKRWTAQAFYRVLRFFSDKPRVVIYNHADFRLMSRRVLDVLEGYTEVNVFLRGIIPLLGFRQATVFYERKKRLHGVSKYPFRKMLSFAWEGITSFSTRPMHLITISGAMLFFACIGMCVYFLLRHLSGHTITGWTSLAMSVWMFGSLVQLSLGIIGEYIGKIYLETKRRPRYVIEEVLQ